MNSAPDEELVSEDLIQHIGAIIASMGEDERREMAKHLHMPPEELNEMIENWRRSRQ